MQVNDLKDFLNNYGTSLAERVNDELEVVHDPLRDVEKDMDTAMNRLNKKPFPVQRESNQRCGQVLSIWKQSGLSYG